MDTGDRKPGGDGGIRTLDTGVSPYNGLANRRLQPLGHLSGGVVSFYHWDGGSLVAVPYGVLKMWLAPGLHLFPLFFSWVSSQI